MKLGIFGGTFDPVHHGHLLIAERIRESEQLDRVVFVPAGSPPHRDRASAGVRDRLRMVGLATAGNPFFKVSDFEAARPDHPSYTIETVRFFLRRRGVKPEVFLLVGLDAFAEIGTWREIESLAGMVTFLVAARPGAREPATLPAGIRWRMVETGLFDYSAREIRARLARHKDVRYLVPESVRRYISTRELYRDPGRPPSPGD